MQQQQAQLHTHISVPYWSPDIWLGLELLRDIQFGLPAILNNSLASYEYSILQYSGQTIITCVMNALTWPEVGVATQNFSVYSLWGSDCRLVSIWKACPHSKKCARRSLHTCDHSRIGKKASGSHWVLVPRLLPSFQLLAVHTANDGRWKAVRGLGNEAILWTLLHARAAGRTGFV